MTTGTRPEIPQEMIEGFCSRWKIKELAVFGSILRVDFGADSDVDVLVTFDPDANWSVFDLSRMRGELSDLLGREADIVEPDNLRNPFRRREILATRKVIYAA